MGNHLQIPPRMEEIRQACAFVAQAAQAAGLSDQAIYHVEVAVEEVCANIISHGFTESGITDGYIDITTDQDADHFIVTIADNSPAFNPLLFDGEDVEANKMEPGGLGIHFLKKMIDSLTYQYRGGENRITLRKRLGD
jgi:serine/threonine-protein kinase RsbW